MAIGRNLLQRTRCTYFTDREPCNKRTPGSGCAANEGNNRMQLSSGERCLHRHASFRHFAVALACAGRVHSSRCAVRPASDMSRWCGRFSSASWATRRSATPISMPDEIITAVELPPKGFADELQLPEDPRPAVICVRPGLGRGRARARWRHHQGGALRARRRGAQAVARSAGRSGAARAAGQCRRRSPARRTCCCAMPKVTSTTPSRSTSRAVASCARSRKRHAARRMPSHPRR